MPIRSTMFRTILFPTDLSINSLHAIRYGLELFKNEKEVRYILFNCYEDHGSDVTLTPYLQQHLQDASRLMLERVHQQLMDEGGRKGPFMELWSAYGGLPYALNGVIEERQVDLVVLGTSGAGGPSLSLMGRNSYAVMKELGIPVLAVPLQASLRPPKTIALACDPDTDPGNADLAPLHALANLASSRLVAVRVTPSQGTASEMSKGTGKAGTVADGIPLVDIPVADPVQGVQLAIGEHAIDMLALLMRERGFFQDLFHRSVSKALEAHIKVPVLSLHMSGEGA